MDVLKSAINKTPKKPEEVQYKDLGPNFKKSFLKLFDDEEKTKEGNVKAEDEVDYDESIDSIKVNIFYDMQLAIDLGMEFSPFQYRMNRKIFNAVEKIKLGPKYLYYLHYE